MQKLVLEQVVKRTELELNVGDYVAIPDNVWVFDKETKELLQMTEIRADRAHTIVLAPKIAGG